MRLSLSLNAVSFELIAKRREKTLRFNISSWTRPARLLTLFQIKIRRNGNEKVETLTPEPTTPDTTNKETGNTHRGNRKGNFRHGKEGGASWSERKYFKGETPKLNAVLSLINERLDQWVTFENSHDFLKNDVLKKFRKAEDTVEIITDLNNPVTNFDTKHMPDDLTKKGEESKIKMNMWGMQFKLYMD